MHPPTIANGCIESNPPYESNEAITYTCPANYTLNGTDENVCTGPPDYTWVLSGPNLPSCLRGKQK